MTDQVDAPEPSEAVAEEVVADAVADEVTEVADEQKGDEPSESSTEKEEKAEKKPNPAQKRIDELTRNRREAERDRDYWREQAMKKEPEKPVEAEPLKTLQDFDYDEAKYQDHLFAKAQEGAVDAARKVLKEEQGRETTSRKASSFRGKEAEFSKSVDDYHDVVTNPGLSISQTMAEVSMDMKNGPEVLYYLGKNPDLADEISRLPPLSAARELGRIEAKVLSQNKKGETVSKAPAPAPKLAAVEASTKLNPSKGESDKMSDAAWFKGRTKQVMRK